MAIPAPDTPAPHTRARHLHGRAARRLDVATSQQLQAEARQAVRRRPLSLPDDVAAALPWFPEGRPLDGPAVVATLVDDPAVRTLPDGRLVHVPSVVEARVFTTVVDPASAAAGLVAVHPDLSVAVLPFGSWQRIPVRAGRLLGMAERATSSSGADVLVIHRELLPPPGQLLGVQPGPEGLALAAAAADVNATADLGRALGRPVAPPNAVTTPWDPVDRVLLALARDTTLCRVPTAPLGGLLMAAPPAPPAPAVR